MVPFVHSNYDRKDDDDYQTIDKRCLYALLQYVNPVNGAVDVCSLLGSRIVDTLHELGFCAAGMPDALADYRINCHWIITNPPYSRPLVDQIINKQIERVASTEAFGFAALLRANFDFAKSRKAMFETPLYVGQIRMRFRPWWSEERKAQPIHNYVWHIWARHRIYPFPCVFYSDGEISDIGKSISF